MTNVELYLRRLTGSYRSPSTEVAEIPRPATVPRKPTMIDKIVFCDDEHPFDVEVCKVRLDKMFRDSFFSVCEVDTCMKLLKVSRTSTQDSYNRLYGMHCISWRDMSPLMLDMIPVLISNVLTSGSYPEDNVVASQ